MPNFKKSDGFQMKRGTSPTFKDLGSSPAKVNWAQIGGLALGGLPGMVAGGAIKRHMDGTTASEKKFEDVLESEGLKRNFWGKLGFGGGNTQARAARIKELQEQDQMGIDRERIESRGGVTAGP